MIAKLTLKSLAAHKLRLALTALAVVMGTAFVAGTMIFGDTTTKAFDELFQQTGKGVDAVVRAKQAFGTGDESESSAKPIPASFIEQVRRVNGVEKVQGEVDGFAAIVGKDGKTIGGGGPPQFGLAWSQDADLSAFRLTSGNPPRAPNEIAIDSVSAQKAGYRVGDQVKIVLQKPAQTFTLAGIFAFGPSGITGGATLTAFEPTTAQGLLLEPGTFSRILVHAKDGVSQEQVRTQVAAVLPAGYEAITGKRQIEESASDVKEILGFVNIFLLVFAFISVFVGTFIIFNTFSMLVAQRTRELALLRAVGASRKQVTRGVLGEAIGVGVVASTLGLVAGFGLAYGLRALFKAFGADMPTTGMVLQPDTILWTYAVGVIVTTVAAYFPARRAAKIPPVAAMRDDVALPVRSLRFRLIAGVVASALGIAALAFGLNGSGISLVGLGVAVIFVGVAMLSPMVSKPITRVLGWPFAKLFGPVGRMSRENAQRNPRRTAATAAALMIGLALTATVSVLAASMKTSVDEAIETGLGADYIVASADGFTPFSPDTLAALGKVPGIDTAAAVQSGNVKVNGEVDRVGFGNTVALARPLKVTMESGSLSLGRDEILADRKLGAAKGWKVGSAVPAEYPDGETTSLRVAGIYKENPLASGIFMDTSSYAPHFPSKLLDQVLITKSSGADAAATKRGLEAALAGWPNVKLMDQSGIKEQARGQVTQIQAMITALLVLSIIIAVFGVVNTLALSVVERTREIGLLRAVGMSRRQLRRMIRYESVVISVFGAVLGLGLGVAFGWALQRAMRSEGVNLLSIPIGQLAIYVLVAAVIGVIAAIWPARRAARMDVLRAITTE